MNAKVVFLIFMLNNFCNNVTSENILVVMPLCASSHSRSFIPLVEELIRKGHNVTEISMYPMVSDMQTTYTHVAVKTNFCQLWMQEPRNYPKKSFKTNRFTYLHLFYEFAYHFTEEVLSLPEVQRIIHSSDHYDLIIAELFYMDTFLAFGYKFKAPVVAVCSTNLMFIYSWILGHPYPSSYVPNQLLGYTGNMPLSSRISNMVFNFYSVLYYELVALPRIQQQMERFFHFDQNDVPDAKDIMKNITLVLVNSHYLLGYIKPELPNVVNIAGLHHPSKEPLSKRIKTFMEGANHGVIYFSLGSFIAPSQFEEFGKTIIQELKSFPQRVIMKWNPKLLTEIPDNILVEEWTSQTQILNHPNCRLFITHGGIHSLIESLNASVPILGIPLVSDQFNNLAAAEHLGIGRRLSFDEVLDRLSAEIKEILNNPRYKENVIKSSQLFRDRLVDPLDEAMFWMEHIMKHKTATHLKPAALHLNWYEFYAVDIFVILLAMILSTLLVMKLLIAWICKSFLARNTNLNRGGSQIPERKNLKAD